MTRPIRQLVLAGGLGLACAVGAFAQTPGRPDPASPRSVLAWAMTLERAGWDYLGSTSDAVYFTRLEAVGNVGGRAFSLRAELFEPTRADGIRSSIALMEADCRRFYVRRIRNRMYAAQSLRGEVLQEDPASTEWFEPPGRMVPAALIKACLATKGERL